MRPGGAAGRADGRDDVAALYAVTGRNCERRKIVFDSARAERHLVEIVAIRIFAEVRGTQTADAAALTALIECADAGDDRQLSRSFFNRVQLRAQRFDGLAELLVRRLQLAVLALQFRKLVRLRQGCEG